MTSEHSSSPTLIRWSPTTMKGKEDVKALLDQYRAATESGKADDKVLMRELRLQAFSHLANPQFPSHTPSGNSPEEALKGKRAAYRDGKSSEIQVYEQSMLKCGNVVSGFAIIESADTTILVPPGSRYTVDQYLNGLMEEE
jgi:N-methylhydantoinase A/oxoprolinase/acetone carboxylase beta subunit